MTPPISYNATTSKPAWGANVSRSRSSSSSSSSGSERRARTAPVRKWDGAKRTHEAWDSLDRDPDLWMRDGNCLVYLHGRGRRKRDPSFKLPISALLAAKCFPFIERFLVTDGHRPRTVEEMERWHCLEPRRTVELYIPPPTTDKAQAHLYHLATRNFLAWAVRRSLVGESLGTALVDLLHNMREFRAGVEDNVADVIEYLDEEGYLYLAGQPHHAMALLTFSEHFQLGELYSRAFPHCVGMSERLHFYSEYRNISVASRELIRRARAEMDAKLDKTSAALRNFLDEELSEAHVGIPSNVRAHLDRFRSFLISFYSTKLGYYPPRSFDANIYRTLGDDFTALYTLLEDDDTSDFIPAAAPGGICTLQIVQAFDARNDFAPLKHQLPLLPQLDRLRGMRRVARLALRRKARADQQRRNHAALVKASNRTDDVLRNSLVRAYRRFEENLVVSPSKADRHEKVSLVDARKVRWILVYAIHQTLRHATKRPAGVPDDPDANYLLTPSVDVLPWQEACNTEQLANERMYTVDAETPLATWGDPSLPSFTGGIEIKPDIDYFALTHKSPPPSRRGRPLSTCSVAHAPTVSRSNSVTQGLSRSSTFRKSVRLLKRAATSPPKTALSSSQPAFHEIVVHGYGNGTNSISLDTGRLTALETSVKWASRSASTASQTNSSASSTSTSMASPAETQATSVSSSVSTLADASLEAAFKKRRWSQQDATSIKSATPSPTISRSNSTKRRPMSAAIDGYNYARSFGQFMEKEGRNMLANAAGISRRHSITIPELKRGSSMQQARSMPLPNTIDEEPGAQARDSCDWAAMDAFLTGRTAVDVDGNGVPEWEQYVDLGGLTAVR